jgi:hypothetical protein
MGSAQELKNQKEDLSMKLAPLLFSACLLLPAPANAAGDVTQPIRQFIDGFNKGDTKSAFAAYATGTITIVDEFPPHRWVGPKAAETWAADFDKFSKANGVTDANVKYGDPTRSEVSAKAAYVIVPTVYTFKEKGQAMTEDGQMTFVLLPSGNDWKISGWTWSGVKPHPAE